LCGGCFSSSFLRSGAEAPTTGCQLSCISFFAPLTVLESSPPPLAGNLGLARKTGYVCSRKSRTEQQGTRDLEKERAERRKRGMGGACRVRDVPLEAPPSNYRGSCKEKNARQPSCMCTRSGNSRKSPKGRFQCPILSREAHRRRRKSKTAQLPKRPARRKINRRPLVLVEVPLDVLRCCFSLVCRY